MIDWQKMPNKALHYTATRNRTADQEYDLSLFFQSNKPFVEEARQSGNNPVAADVALSSK
jgi:hypothetical protein